MQERLYTLTSPRTLKVIKGYIIGLRDEKEDDFRNLTYSYEMSDKFIKRHKDEIMNQDDMESYLESKSYLIGYDFNVEDEEDETCSTYFIMDGKKHYLIDYFHDRKNSILYLDYKTYSVAYKHDIDDYIVLLSVN